MNAIDGYIRALHAILGHDKTAAYLGMPVGNKGRCMLCHPQLEVTEDTGDTP